MARHRLLPHPQSEAAVSDALSIATLDHRRLGLYLNAKDFARAPGKPMAAVVSVRWGSAPSSRRRVAAKDTGYCHFKSGAYLAVSSIEPAN